jgi:copper homeostasis protein
MARPRAGDFIYDDADRARLHAMVQAMGDAGADGVVFGILTTNYTIDADALRDLVAMCANRESVFHRAFDQTPDALEALDTLISCGVTRILTSGHAPIATEGAATIAELLTRAAGKIQILPGSGVRANNVVALVQRTRVTQVHARATEPGVIARIKAAIDASTSLGA